MARICIPDARWLIALIALTLTSGSAVSAEREAYRKAETLWRHGEWRAAETLLRQSLADSGTSDSDDVWQMRLWLSDALTAQTKYGEAAAVLALEPPARLEHSAIAVTRILDLATLEFRQKKGHGAERELLARAEALARRYQRPLLADVYGRRATVELELKNFRDAERDALLSVRLASRQRQRIFEINALGILGALRTQQRRFDEALTYYRRSLALAVEVDARSKIEKVSGNIGWTLIELGDFDGAAEILGSALTTAESIGAAYDTVPVLDNLGNIFLHNRDYHTAFVYYQRGVVVARRIAHPHLAEFVDNTAVASLALSDIGSARKANDEARSLIDPNDAEQLFRSAIIDARIDAAAGQIELAITKIRRVIDTAPATRQWEAEGRLAEFLFAAGRRSDAADQFSHTLQFAANARKSIKTEELRLSFGSLVRQFTEEYVDLLLSQGRVPEALDVVETSRAQTLDEALDTTAVRWKPQPMRVAADRHAVILSYWITPEHSYLWTITPSSIAVTPIGSGTVIEREVDAYSRELESLRTNALSMKRGAALYAKLVQPVAKQIPRGAHLIVVPDGRLQTFNLETLIAPSTHYWIEDVTIETTPSLTLLNRSRSESSQSMLLIGDPPSATPEFPRLRKAADELSAVQHRFAPACTTLIGARATPRAYRLSNAGAFGYIHFVAHGIASRSRPLESAVVLANDGGSYKLYARDIIKQKLHARLVTISSCHGAGTRAYTGEGLVGLAWAFLHAGAHQVIAALWEVDDNATPTLMDDLYAGIRAGQDPATALRNAKLNLIHSPGAFRQPRYWAPFVLYSGS